MKEWKVMHRTRGSYFKNCGLEHLQTHPFPQITYTEHSMEVFLKQIKE